MPFNVMAFAATQQRFQCHGIGAKYIEKALQVRSSKEKLLIYMGPAPSQLNLRNY